MSIDACVTEIDDDFRFKTPCTCIVAGSSSSGKTTLQCMICDNYETLFDVVPEKIYYVCHIIQPVFDKYKNSKIVKFFEGWNHEELAIDQLRKTQNLSIIIDDSLHDSSPGFLRLCFSHYSHHFNINFFLGTHDLFDPSFKDLRFCSLQSKYFIILSSPRAFSSVRTLALQTLGSDWRRLTEAYQHVCSTPFQHILLDLHPRSSPRFSIRANIFQQNQPMIVFLSKCQNK